ncbi:MAG: hypothetical protein KJ060_03795 [Candidatus Hydrogenedentes bacterium]|nr:hypothetical protein [Candidatus Hydrogenedentota bacterium]
MNDKRLNEELSAYLDDESKDKARIADLLKNDPEAVRKLSEYSALSKALKALPAPEVHPAFATRVLAQARETRRASAWSRAPRLAGGVVLSALIVGFCVWAMLPGTVPSTPQEQEPEVAAVLELRHSDEPLGPFASLMDEDLLDSPVALTEGDIVPSDEAQLAADEASMESAVESIVWLASAAPAGSDSEELDAMLGDLDDTEITVLRELLVEYAMEDDAI